MKTYRDSAQYQEKVSTMVQREVILCASYLVSELLEKAEHHPDIQDDLYSLAYRPATEEDIEEGYEDGSEVFEHWIVSEWLGKRLEAKKETVVFDILGFPAIWGRTTTGQSISIDGVICDIYDEVQEEIQRLSLI